MAAKMISLMLMIVGVHADNLVTITETHQNQRDWKRVDTPVPSFTRHEVVFAIKHANMDVLEHELMSRVRRRPIPRLRATLSL
jgi:hypothetical protein